MSGIQNTQGLPLSLPGATLSARFAGATVYGPPTSGTFGIGDYVLSRLDGAVYVCTSAGTPGTWVNAAADPMLKALGLLAWNYNPDAIAAAQVLTSQLLYGIVVPTFAGITYTGVKLAVQAAGTSTAPTSFQVGLASNAALGSKGTMLAQSGNLNASSALTTLGAQSFPFSGTYTETVTGLRVVLLLQDGAFAGTNVTFARTAAGNTFGSASGQQALAETAGSGTTAFQANGNLLAAAYASGSAVCFWAGLY